ncbi:MAG: hypothetical protein L0Z53_20070 [Acidobacteriales bacterium]|nr:hypothetical protein [Terriglobales bacterium]
MDLFNQVEPLQVLFLVFVAIGLYGLARWARTSTEGGFHIQQNTETPIAPDEPSWSADVPPLAVKPEPTFGPEPQLGPVRITRFSFPKFDLATGPQDPDSFYDELFVELYDAETGHRWMHSYGVATPQGLNEILNDKKWNYLYANGIIVVPRYDLTAIREAVVARIAEDNEAFKPAEKIKEESL